MKSLNRTLSLVLVLCMVFGLFGVAGAAFTDASTIKYTEAVDVMSTIGVMNGMDAGAFNPTAKLTREQAAKIICYLTMGQTAADTLKATTAPFKDVAADRWSAGSIAYCVSQGIIAGRGDGTFAPTAEVTGYEFAKMLLVTLGYDATIEGFTGASWSINVAKRAYANKLFDGNDAFVGTAALSREEAALYTLNLVQATTVTYASKGTNIVVNGTTINTGATPATQTGNLTFMASYYPKLLVTTSTDDFGRVASVWTYKGVQIGAYAATAKVTLTAAKNFTAGKEELSKTFKNFTADSDLATAGDQAVTVKVNGKAAGTVSTATLVNDIAALTANGTKVEVFVYSTNVTTIKAVSVVKTDLTRISAVDTARKIITLSTKSASVAGTATYEIKEDSTSYAAVKDLKVDDYVLVTPYWNGTAYKVASVAIPKTVTGYITTKIQNPNTNLSLTVTVDGTTPYTEGAAKTSTVAYGSVAPSTTIGATLLLDSYGYVVNIKAASVANKNFMYVLDAYSTLASGKIVPTVKGVLTDGTVVTVEASGAGSGTTGLKDIGVIANDVYPLTNNVALGAAGATANAAINKVVALTATGVINAYDKTLTAATQGGGFYYNNYYASDVKFVYINTAAKTATVKTGVQAVANIPASSFAVVEPLSATDPTPVVTAVYLVDGVAATVASDSLVFIPSNVAVATTELKNSTTGKFETYPVYVGYINGVQTNIPTKSVVASGAYYTSAKVDDVAGGLVLAAYTLTTGTSAVKTNVATAPFDDRLIKVGGTEVDISSATFADVRTDASKTNAPVILNAAGVCAAQAKYAGLTLGVIYNADTGKATLVYVCSAVHANAAPGAIAAAAPAGGYSFAVDKATAIAGDTITVTVTNTAAPAAGTDTVVVKIGTTTIGTVTFTAADTAAKTITYTMPDNSVTLTATRTNA